MTVHYGLARVLSKRGLCSRSEAERRIKSGEVRVGGRIVRDPEFPTRLDQSDIVMGAGVAESVERRYIALNKPRGLVTTAQDERGRATVYRCFDGMTFPGWHRPDGWIKPVRVCCFSVMTQSGMRRSPSLARRY